MRPTSWGGCWQPSVDAGTHPDWRAPCDQCLERHCPQLGVRGRAACKERRQAGHLRRGEKGSPRGQVRSAGRTRAPTGSIPASPWDRPPLLQTPAVPICELLFSRICFSSGEYSRTIKYSTRGSCCIHVPVFVQQTSSEARSVPDAGGHTYLPVQGRGRPR